MRKVKLIRWGLPIPVCLFVAFGAWAQDDAESLSGQPYVEGSSDASQEEYPEEEYVEEYVEEAPPLPPPVIRPKVLPTRPLPSSMPRVPQPIRSMSSPGGSGQSTLNSPTPEKSGALPIDAVNFDFNEAPLYDVISMIARLTGRNFDVDPNIGAATVTIITHDKIPPEMAYEVLESILATRGFSLVETLDGHLINVIPTPEATMSEKIPVTTGAGQVRGSYDDYTTHIVTVKHTDASELATALKILASKNARIDTYVPTNTLILTDTADGLRRMFSFLDAADVPGYDTVMEIYTLEYTRAEVISTQLEQVLLDTEGGMQGQPGLPQRPTPTRPTRPVRPTIPGAETNQVIGSRMEVLRMVPDERLNALIVVASEGMMERVRDLVRRLDTPTPYEANNLHIYQLLNADAEQVEAALQPLIGTAPRAAGGGAAGGGAAVGGGGGAAQSAEVQPFEQRVQITRYDQTNSLLIVASPQDYKLLEAFIARLDVQQRQVYVDAIVMDVTVSDDYGLTVDAASITGNDGFGVTNTGNIAQLATVAQAADQIVGGPGATLAAGLFGLGTEGGITGGVFDDLEVTIGGQQVKIPFVPLLFQAIEKISDVEVLSQPGLATVDNEEASIVVGQEVPFITSTSRGLSGGGGNDNVNLNSNLGFTRVEREEVGVKLKVTPQISEGDNVLLELELEVSDTDATQIGTVDILGPTTNKSLVTNKVLVKDGSTAVIAGLIRDVATRSNTQAPILGDIPWLGWLFKSKSNRREKRNMVVLVTPHVVKEGIDSERITQHKIGQFQSEQLDRLFEDGFFQKVAKKKASRQGHRPTAATVNSMRGATGEESFGRGDIKR